MLLEMERMDEAAQRVCLLIENPILRKEMGIQARKNIQRYDRDVVMKRWTDLFVKVST